MREKALLTLQQAFEHPLHDKGERLQALAVRHARLLLVMNIWHQSVRWTRELSEHPVTEWYALRLYTRIIRRYHFSAPIPDHTNSCDPLWLEDTIMSGNGIQETSEQTLARLLYITAFSETLKGFHFTYMGQRANRWNREKVGKQKTILDV